MNEFQVGDICLWDDLIVKIIRLRHYENENAADKPICCSAVSADVTILSQKKLIRGWSYSVYCRNLISTKDFTEFDWIMHDINPKLTQK
jgi:hypothetical protein